MGVWLATSTNPVGDIFSVCTAIAALFTSAQTLLLTSPSEGLARWHPNSHLHLIRVLAWPVNSS